MKILIIGGTGIISSAVVERALADGHQVTILNRGKKPQLHPEAEHLIGDSNDVEAMQALLRDRSFDIVANFVLFTPDQAQRDVHLFEGKCRQYMYISSASAYRKPATHWLLTESTPLGNAYWDYSRAKEEAEQVFLNAHRTMDFPVTIVRPSHTYGFGKMPTAVHGANGAVPVLKRMLDGKPVILPGDGSSLWTVTWNEDLAKGFNGLFGCTDSIGQAYHITSDEAYTWNSIYQIIGFALGVTPIIHYVTSRDLIAKDPALEGPLLGDKAVSTVFDNTKIKRAVPSFICETSFRMGAAKVIQYLDQHPELWDVEDAAFDAFCDSFTKDGNRF